MRNALVLACSLAGCTGTTALAPAPAPAPTLAARPLVALAHEPVTPHPFVDHRPPEGWRQCAGFVNTSADDVAGDFLDPCLGGDRLRVRVFTPDNAIEEDVFVTGITPLRAWPDNYFGAGSTLVTQTHWGGQGGGAASVLMTRNDGTDACGQVVAPGGVTLGSGHAHTAIIVAEAAGEDEYRISCGGAALPGRKIAVYR